MKKAGIKFWLSFWGCGLAAIIGVAVIGQAVMYILQCAGQENFHAGIAEALLHISTALPYDLLAIGAIFVAIYGPTYFQQYYFAVLSMGATRKTAVWGVWTVLAGWIISIWLLIALTRCALPGNAADSGLPFLWPSAAGLMFMGASGMFIGALMARGRKWGKIVYLVFCFLLGGIIGIAISTAGNDLQNVLAALLHNLNWAVTAVSAILFIISGFFAQGLNRKIEVRV